MSKTGTNEAERGLNVPKSEEELADLVLTAVSEGNTEEMDRLFSVSVQPDEKAEDEEDSEQDSTETDGDEKESKESDSQTEEESNKGPDLTTQQTPSPAEERLAKLEQQLNDAKAAVGRTAALQSRLAQLERQLKAQQAKKPEEPSAEEKELDDRIARLKEIDPDTAAILETLKKQQARAKPQEASDNDDEALREEYYKVLEVHADADKIFNHPYWHQWKATLTPEQREWASSSDSQKVIVALNAYKEFINGFPGNNATAPTPPPVATEVEDVVDATKLTRDKKLQRSADSSDKPVKKTQKLDEDALFAEAYEKIAKEAGITY